MSRTPEELELENHTGMAEVIGGFTMAVTSAELIPNDQLSAAFVAGGLYAIVRGLRRCWTTRL